MKEYRCIYDALTSFLRYKVLDGKQGQKPGFSTCSSVNRLKTALSVKRLTKEKYHSFLVSQINKITLNCEYMSGEGGVGLRTFSDVQKFDKKYVKNFDFASGGAFAPPKQNLKRRACYVRLLRYMHNLYLYQLKYVLYTRFNLI